MFWKKRGRVESAGVSRRVGCADLPGWEGRAVECTVLCPRGRSCVVLGEYSGPEAGMGLPKQQ